MKKVNKKGFVLAEAIVVGVFVLGLFTYLFVNIIPLVGKYEEQESYDTVNGIYNTNLIRAMIMEDPNLNSLITLESMPYKVYKYDDANKKHIICDELEKTNYCNKLLSKNFLNVKTIYISRYKTGDLKTASIATSNKGDFSRAARDYIENMDNFSQYSGYYENYHRIIVEYNDGTLSNVEVKVRGND